MGTMASTIMGHMEMGREAEQHRRGMKMSRGLASFLEERTELNDSDTGPIDEESSMVVGQFEIASVTSTTKTISNRNSRAGSQSGLTSSIGRKEKEYSTAMIKTEEEIMAISQKGDTVVQAEQCARISDSLPAPGEVVSMSPPSKQVESPSKDPLSRLYRRIRSNCSENTLLTSSESHQESIRGGRWASFLRCSKRLWQWFWPRCSGRERHQFGRFQQ
jgi:hypothetical protein